MEDPPANLASSPRSAAYLAKMERRRSDLAAQLGRIFPQRANFTWELGCGHGHFLTAYALEHPDKLCVGIDIVGERIERAERKRDRAKLKNLFFVHAEARLFLDVLPAGASFAELFILFPDPWPKLRHHKHRILQAEFLSRAAERSTADALLCFRTDYGPYYDDACRMLRGHPLWRPSDDPWPFEYSTVFQSRAEQYQSVIARRIRGPGSS